MASNHSSFNTMQPPSLPHGERGLEGEMVEEGHATLSLLGTSKVAVLFMIKLLENCFNFLVFAMSSIGPPNSQKIGSSLALRDALPDLTYPDP